MKWILYGVALVGVSAFAADAPPATAFRVLPPAPAEGPVITRYLEYQTDMAWREDTERQERWRAIRTEQDLTRLEQDLREHLLAMLGGLPATRTPLNARITGRIPMSGFHIEKLIFESLPGVYVTALVYVPDDVGKKHPAVLVPSGHSAKGKAYYQALCQRLVERGYVVICWDPVGQGERSQFWDRKNGKSRYNLICAEHAVLGNLAYLAGTNLARWEIWDGMRAVDYLLTRSDVDPERINITGTSGGGFQTALIAALDPRIKVAAPSCYITALPMRVYNRIFKDPDSDPEQDLEGMISGGGHPGVLLMMYPRPVFVAAAVLDFFPIEGTHQTFREVADLYSRFGHSDRISMREGYTEHQFSPENQQAMMEFLDHFNGMPPRHDLPPVKEVDDQTLQSTRSGQVMLDFENARSLMDVIRDYYLEHRSQPARTVKELYYADSYPGIDRWRFSEFDGGIPAPAEVRWQAMGSSTWGQVRIDRYLLRHGRYLEMPLLWIHKNDRPAHRALLWLGENGKATERDWPQIAPYLESGFDIISIDPRGLGETRMPYRAISPDDPTLGQMDFDRAYVNPLSGVLADYVYNSLLTGRPYFLQMMEDTEIAMRFARRQLAISDFEITGMADAYSLASAVSETLPNVKLVRPPGAQILKWSDVVEHQRELWPIQDLLPGGAYIH
jgi:pimeloyl-ACP methyl ester carboxylesterase